MKEIVAITQKRIFIVGCCSVFCFAVLFFAVQPNVASGDDDAVLRELQSIRQEITEIRQALNMLLPVFGIQPKESGASEDSSQDSTTDTIGKDVKNREKPEKTEVEFKW